jgi:hypothetical protein
MTIRKEEIFRTSLRAPEHFFIVFVSMILYKPCEISVVQFSCRINLIECMKFVQLTWICLLMFHLRRQLVAQLVFPQVDAVGQFDVMIHKHRIYLCLFQVHELFQQYECENNISSY